MQRNYTPATLLLPDSKHPGEKRILIFAYVMISGKLREMGGVSVDCRRDVGCLF